MSAYITTTSGQSGFFAVMIGVDEHGPDILQTGSGRYADRAAAEREGRDWAKAEELEFRP